jgi:hypothetical protein
LKYAREVIGKQHEERTGKPMNRSGDDLKFRGQVIEKQDAELSNISTSIELVVCGFKIPSPPPDKLSGLSSDTAL